MRCRLAIVVLLASFASFAWRSPAALGEPITSASVGGYLFTSFETPGLPSFDVRTNRPKRISLDVMRSDEYGNQGQFVGVLNLTGGKRPMIDLACSATGSELHHADTYACVNYAYRVVQRDPDAPLMPVWVSLTGQVDIKVTPKGEPDDLSVYGNIMFRTSSNSSWEYLAGGGTHSGHIYTAFDDSRIVPVGGIGYLQIQARGQTKNPSGGGGEWQVVADPIISIDRTKTVLVNGIEVPAWQLYDIEMSDGFLPAYGEPFTWVNPAGGAFEEATNWDTYDGPAVPQDDADLEFMSLPEGRVFPVTLDQSRTIAGLSVCDADVTLQLEGHRLENTGPIFVGQLGPDRGLLDIQNGTLAAAGGVKLGMSPDVEGIIRINAGATLETTHVSLNSFADHMLGSGTLVLDGGTLLAEDIIVQGPRAALVFNSGSMTLDGGSSSFYTGSVFNVGNGTGPAELAIVSGFASFSDGLTLAPGAVLDLRGGQLWTPSFEAAPSSTVTWSGGKWICGSPLALGDAEPLGGELVIDAAKELEAQGGLHVRSSGRLAIDGGVVTLQTLTHDAGASLEYASGRVQLDSGDITIGPGEFTGPDGSEAVTLAGVNDRLGTSSGALTVREGYVLQLAAGAVEATNLVVEGVLDFGGPTPDEPGRGQLGLFFGGPELGRLRIGSGNGDAVINGRTVVKVGPEGGIGANGGSLRVDAGYELHLFGTGDVEENPGAWADRVELAGTILLDQGRLQAGQLVVESTGCLAGNGVVLYGVENGGLVSPGLSPGTIQIWGDYNQTFDGKLVLEIASPTEFDSLLIWCNAHLAGTLEIVLRDGFVPEPGQSFNLIAASYLDGEFGEVIVRGGTVNVMYSPTGLIVTAVPEPSTLALVAGLIVLMAATKKRKGPQAALPLST